MHANEGNSISVEYLMFLLVIRGKMCRFVSGFLKFPEPQFFKIQKANKASNSGFADIYLATLIVELII